MNFYLIGYPVEHSISPAMHNASFKKEKLPHKYNKLNVPPKKIPEVIRTKIRVKEFGGANVTIPHKIEIIKHLDCLSETARTAGAVNTIEYRDNTLIGHNTDAVGGIKVLREKYGELTNTKVVLLGAGGAARALAAELLPQIKELIILNRTLDKARTLANKLGENISYDSLKNQRYIESANILINATPVGMYPKIGDSPVEAKYLHPNLFVYDIVYNPFKTRLLKEAERLGARTLGGLWMLVYQGAEAFNIWTGLKPNIDTMYNAAFKALEAKGQ
jgi:shikimate dehydrogenase